MRANTTPPPSDPAAELRLLLLAPGYTEDGALAPQNLAEVLQTAAQQVSDAIDRLTAAITDKKELPHAPNS